MTLAPGLFEGGGHPHKQEVGPAGPDLLDDAEVIVQAEVAVAETSDLDPRIQDTARFYQRRDHLAPSAEEIDAQPVLSSRRQETRHEVHASHSLRYRLTRCPQGPDH